MDQLNLIDRERKYFHSAMRSWYESWLRSILEKVAAHVCNCGVVYHSDADMQRGAYESTVQRSVKSLLVSLGRSLEDLRRDDVLANPQ